MSDGQILHFFGGKGGAGKSTLATAFALNLCDRFPKEKILLIASEPAQSLEDLLNKKLSSKPVKVVSGKGEGGLFAAEQDPKHAEALLKKYRPALTAAAQKGSLLSEADTAKLFEHHPNGLSELASLLWIQSALESGEFNRVVVDLSGVATELRLFELPEKERRFLNLARGISGKGKKEAPTTGGFLEELAGQLDKLSALLKDAVRTSFHLVALPEPVGESQTRLLFTQLRERVAVTEIIANQVEERGGCPACQGRRGLQAPHVRKFQALDKGLPVYLLGKREVPPRGQDGLKKLATEWLAGKETKALEFAPAEGPPALVRAPSMPPIAAPPLPPTRLIFFVGQGGVGKSSCAAAAAVTLTEKEGPVLLISIDPAHSLSDVLQSRLTDTETQVKGTKGLYARELDTSTWFSNLKKRIKEKAEKAFESAGRGGDIAYDRELLRNLVDAAPAMLEELPAISVLAEALLQERFKRIVVDPIPAGESVRILELPEVAKAWLSSVHAVISKYRTKGLGELADELATLEKHVKRFEDALGTPAESRFVVVTRGEELAQPKTERLVEYLKGKKVPVERVLVNRVLPKTGCDKCENRRKNELDVAKAIEKKVGMQITVAPALGRHPAGLRELKAFRTSWYALSPLVKSTKAA